MLETPAELQPLRRTEGITVQHVGDETLLYNEQTHQAFCLNKTTALVWNGCDGTRTPSALAAALFPETESLSAETVVRFALGKLSKDHLITGYAEPDLPGVSRRAMLLQGGAGLALMMPVIAILATPRAAQAYSGCFNCSSIPAAAAPTQPHSEPAVESQRKTR